MTAGGKILLDENDFEIRLKSEIGRLSQKCFTFIGIGKM
jgi:hypothetical protein